MISIFAAYMAGIKDVYKNKKLVFIFFAVQFVFAYVLTKPFSELLSTAFSKSTAGDAVLNQFDLIYFYTMFRELGQGVSFFGLLLPAIIMYILITVFLTAGVYWLFYSKSEFSFTEFFAKCGTYFSRFFKLFGVSFLFYFTAFLIYILLGSIFSNFTQNTVTEVLPVILTFTKIVILIIIFAVIMMIFDYAKIELITENSTGIFSAVFMAFKFFMMNIFKTFGIYFLYILTAIIIFAAFNLLNGYNSTDTSFTILLYFVLAQLFILARQFLRLALYGSLIVYYQNTVTAMPGMLNKEMLEMAVEHYEKRAAQ